MLLKRQLCHIFETLRKAPFSTLMLDYDGTLAPFTTDRGNAMMYPGFGEVIESISESKKTKVVMVTGRTIKELTSLLKLRELPEIWGSHGWERRGEDGSYYLWPADNNHLEGLAEAKSMIDNRSLGRHSEEKPRSIALHWRGLSDNEALLVRQFSDDSLRDLASNYGLDSRDFDGGVELRVPGRNKGDVVKALISESPEDSFFAYLGDDSTDEDAFLAIKGHGAGILVSESEKPSSAEYLVRPPGDLLEFLRNWQKALKGGSLSAG